MKGFSRRDISVVLLCLLVCFSFVLHSCPAPISLDLVLQVQDSLAPEVAILCPADGGCYAAVLLVSGTVTDSASEEDDNQGSVQSLSYSLLSTPIAGTAVIAQGAFQFVLDMHGLTGTQTLQLQAADWNGNVGTRLITLLDAGSEIPSFVLESGNHEVTFTWDPVPGAESYSLYYTRDGSYPDLPEGANGIALDDVQPGIVVTGTELGGPRLQNGTVHVFRLRAYMPTGYDDLYSNYGLCVPLSPMTLAPNVVSNQSGQITVSWTDVGAGVRYNLWKSENPDDGFYLAAPSTTETEFVDRSVVPGEQNWYRVSLVDLNEVQSTAVPGFSSAFEDSGAADMTTLPTGNIGDFRDVAVEGEFAYAVGRGATSVAPELYAIDIASPDPLHPTIRSQVFFPDGDDGAWGLRSILPETITLFGDYAFVGDPTIGIQVVDTSAPDLPSWEYQIDVIGGWSNAFDLFVDGGNLFVARLASLDIYGVPPDGGVLGANSTYGPNAIGAYTILGWNRGVVVHDDQAFVTNAYPDSTATARSLVVLDVSDRANPSLVSQIDLPGTGYPYKLDVADVGAGAYAFVAKGTDGVLIYDVTDVTAVSPPVLVATVTDALDARDVVVQDDVAYVADFVKDIIAFSVSNPSDPGYMWFRNCPGNGYGIDVDNGYAYLAALTGGLHIVDLGPDSFQFTRTGIDLPPNSTCYDLAVCDDRAYVADGSHGMRIVDIDPQSATYLNILGSCATPGSTVPVSPLNDLANPAFDYLHSNFGIAVRGDYAFMADCDAGLQIIDIDPDHAGYDTIVGSIDLPGQAWDIALAGDYGYVAAGTNGLHVVDVSVPLAPVHAATVDCPGEASAVEVRGDLAYLAAGTGGISIFNIGQREHPVLLGTCDLPRLSSDARATERAIDIALRDHVLYVAFSDLYYAYNSDWVVAVDVSNPFDPEILTKIPVPVACTSLDVSGDYLVVAGSNCWNGDRHNYLQIYDVSDPQGFMLRGEYLVDVPSSSSDPAITQCREVLVRDDTIYCSDVQLIMQAFSMTEN
jgi:hypothetical protein